MCIKVPVFFLLISPEMEQNEKKRAEAIITFRNYKLVCASAETNNRRAAVDTKK